MTHHLSKVKWTKESALVEMDIHEIPIRVTRSGLTGLYTFDFFGCKMLKIVSIVKVEVSELEQWD